MRTVTWRVLSFVAFTAFAGFWHVVWPLATGRTVQSASGVALFPVAVLEDAGRIVDATSEVFDKWQALQEKFQLAKKFEDCLPGRHLLDASGGKRKGCMQTSLPDKR